MLVIILGPLGQDKSRHRKYAVSSLAFYSSGEKRPYPTYNFNCVHVFSTLYSHLEAHLDVEKTARENKQMESSIIQI